MKFTTKEQLAKAMVSPRCCIPDYPKYKPEDPRKTGLKNGLRQFTIDQI